MEKKQHNRQPKAVVVFVALLAGFSMFFGALDGQKGWVADAAEKSQLSQQLQQLLDKAIANSATGTPGAVLLIRTPEFEFAGASGMADLKNMTRMQPTDMLRIASMTKPFVSTVILKLCEAGKLDLDDPMQQYLPKESQRIENGDTVTIRQLLSMTSGIADYDNPRYAEALEKHPPQNPWTPEEILECVYDEQSDFEPGAEFSYCNTNYVILQMIIEKISGASLASEIRRLIFDPLAIRNTFMEMREPRQGGFGGLLVRGYTTEETPAEDLTEENDSLGLGDGGLISDTQGLAVFLDALFDKRTLLDKESLKQMTTVLGEDYGLGLEIIETDVGVSWGHEGKTVGFQSLMRYLPEKQTIFVVLTNEENDNSDFRGELFWESLKLVVNR